MTTGEANGDRVRCVSVPLDRCAAAPGGAGREFWPHMHRAWRLSTDLANWCVGELLRLDVRRTPDMVRLPPMPAVNLYRLWNETAPDGLRRSFDGACGSAASVIRWVHRKWKQDRLRVIWRGEASYASYRYPYPWPVRAQEWKLLPDGGRWSVSVTLPGGRYVYTLAGGREFARQHADLALLHAEPGRRGELRLCPRYSGGRVVGVMCRIAGTFPRPAPAAGGTARVATAPDRLLVVSVPGRGEPFFVNMDHVRQLSEGYERLRQRFAEDTKHEKRWPAWKRRRFQRVGATRAQVRRDRVRTALRQAAACAVGFAARRGCGAVEYDDSERSYLPEWPWAELRAAVRFKCESAGLEFQLSGGQDDGAA